MTEGQPSRTALVAALMRAVHTRLDSPRLIDDPWGDLLVADAEREAMWQRVLAAVGAERRARLVELGMTAGLGVVLRRHPTYAGVIVRTRCAEDALAAAVASGARQYVLVGAGFDSFALRQPPFARALQIIEVDHPASQEMKRRRLHDCGVAIPSNVHFVAADLSRQSLGSALAQSPFSRQDPAFFSWLGVTIYLSREANLATLAAIAATAAHGSQVVFNYMHQGFLDSPQAAELLEPLRAGAGAVGEPWLSGFHPERLASELHGVGLDLLQDWGGRALRERYCQGRSDGLAPSLVGHIALASVQSRPG
jgi:methyltransferase (TIGR00027 family)